jgi:hypothetical protein
MQQRSEVTEEVAIVVKTVPQPSQRYGETVCCARLTRQGEWRRLYPIRFRHFKDKAFSRWQWVQCRTARRASDARSESRRVAEESISPLGVLRPQERPRFIHPLIRGSVAEAAHQGRGVDAHREAGRGTGGPWLSRSCGQWGGHAPNWC